MTFEEKLRTLPAAEVWEEYCGFLEMTMEEYMGVQRRLLEEQIALLSGCGLGRRFLGETPPKTVEEFRARVPLTKYEDYADILLLKREEMLPAAPVIWLETTWEGGDRPFKAAPYTKAMLDTYCTNILAAMLLSTAREKGSSGCGKMRACCTALRRCPMPRGFFPALSRPRSASASCRR